MNSNNWATWRACDASRVPEMMPLKLTLADRAILVCRSLGQVWAVDEMCPHKRESMAYGVVHEGQIICPHHQYAFDLDTGRTTMRRCPPATVYSAQLADDDQSIWVLLPGAR